MAATRIGACPSVFVMERLAYGLPQNSSQLSVAGAAAVAVEERAENARVNLFAIVRAGDENGVAFAELNATGRLVGVFLTSLETELVPS